MRENKSKPNSQNVKISPLLQKQDAENLITVWTHGNGIIKIV